MSWQLATYLLLAAVLAGGFAWYERSRPSARLLGLVAALAALAAAGRVALTPVPNVTPTTDIALLSGYALGGAPGFVVGALAALVSNFWLGQGPWTPWQMAAWGLAGIAGALLARATGRRLGRLGLALACGVAGLLYGALLDLSVMVTYGGEQSLDRYLALSARGIPFNLAHAAGNAAFALAAGPALVAILTRYRSRLDFAWRPAEGTPAPPRADSTGPAGGTPITTRPGSTDPDHQPGQGSAGPGASASPAPAAASGGALALLVALAVTLPLATPADTGAGDGDSARAERRASGAAGARAYLERAQNRDGGFPATPGGSSSVSITGWAMLGLEASGRNPLDLRRAGNSPVSLLRSSGRSIRSTGDIERAILALDGAGVGVRSFAGRDLPSELRRRRSPNGSYQGQVNLTAFGILALCASGAPRPSLDPSADWLREAQNGDGGWGFHPGAQSESDSTGAALQALAAAGSRGRAVSRGAAYLRRSQRSDGGWPLAFGGPTNSQSTAWAVQGLVAAGSSARRASLDRRARPPGAPLEAALGYLAARQAADGHFRYSKSSDQTPVWVTGQALTAIARKAFPLPTAPRAREPGGVPLPARADSETGQARRGPARRGDEGSGGGRRGEDDGRRRGAEAAVRAASGSGKEKRPAAATSPSEGRNGGGADPLVLASAFTLSALALALGFLLYRRHLP